MRNAHVPEVFRTIINNFSESVPMPGAPCQPAPRCSEPAAGILSDEEYMNEPENVVALAVNDMERGLADLIVYLKRFSPEVYDEIGRLEAIHQRLGKLVHDAHAPRFR